MVSVFLGWGTLQWLLLSLWPPSGIGGSFSPDPLHHWLFIAFLMMSTWSGGRWSSFSFDLHSPNNVLWWGTLYVHFPQTIWVKYTPVEIGFLKAYPVSRFCPIITPGLFLKAGVIYVSGLVNIVSISTGFKIVVMGNGHRETDFISNSYSVHHSLAERLVPRLSVRVEYT